ncbi:MAG TPA: hypothetical protein VN651_06380 [Gemmatimonadaceae bacterium]|nr:hypothetical protein [Gemmatimonadaceae bacterium]
MMRVWPLLDSRVEGGQLVVTGTVKPTPITRSYRVRVTLNDFGTPRVYVLSPILERRVQEPDVPIPHTYEYATPGKEQPCLYHPKSAEWLPSMPLALSIMPWLLSWLLDYEYWHATGEWIGGGVPHGSTKVRDDSPSRAVDDRA